MSDEKREYVCYCCGTKYERGKWRCCAPPKNMASHVWLERWCRGCGPANARRCPRHCTCGGAIQERPLSDFAKKAGAEYLP